MSSIREIFQTKFTFFRCFFLYNFIYFSFLYLMLLCTVCPSRFKRPLQNRYSFQWKILILFFAILFRHFCLFLKFVRIFSSCLLLDETSVCIFFCLYLYFLFFLFLLSLCLYFNIFFTLRIVSFNILQLQRQTTKKYSFPLSWERENQILDTFLQLIFSGLFSWALQRILSHILFHS